MIDPDALPTISVGISGAPGVLFLRVGREIAELTPGQWIVFAAIGNGIARSMIAAERAWEPSR